MNKRQQKKDLKKRFRNGPLGLSWVYDGNKTTCYLGGVKYKVRVGDMCGISASCPKFIAYKKAINEMAEEREDEEDGK